MKYKNNLKVIEHAKKELKRFFEVYGFSPDDIKEFCKDGSSYRWKNFDYDTAPKVLKMMSNSSSRNDVRNIVEYAIGFVKIIQRHRERSRHVEDRSAIKKATDNNYVWAQSEVQGIFPSKEWHVKCDKGSRPRVEKRAVSYRDIFDIEIPISWGKAVYSESIATVKAGDGERFVMSAQKKNLGRLAEQGIVAYACDTLKVYRGEATMERAWVFKYEAPDDTILATHKEFSRAESLLNRRIKDTVVKELVDF